jgi:hypothetical protein
MSKTHTHTHTKSDGCSTHMVANTFYMLLSDLIKLYIFAQVIQRFCVPFTLCVVGICSIEVVVYIALGGYGWILVWL